MTNFIEKARSGRVNALSTLAGMPAKGQVNATRNRAPGRHNVVTFSSVRAGRMDTVQF
jgi:hypothetical protein